LSMTDKLRLSVVSGKTLTLAGPLTVPTQGMDLAGAGTLDLSDNLTLNGNVTLASGSLTIDARGLQLNLGGDLNLVGGVLLTDNSTNFHLLANSTLTTNAEQTVANVTIPVNTQPMLTLGSNTTKLIVADLLSVAISCPQSLPVQPKAQLRLPGGIQIDTGGTLCIDGWLEGDIVLNGGTLQVDADTTISSDSKISLSSSSNLKIVDGSSLTYEGDALSVDDKTLSLSGGGSLVLNSDGSNPVTLNNADGELEFSGDSITTVSHVKISSGNTSNAPTLKMTASGVIQNLAHEEFSEINFASGKTLSVEQAFEVPAGKQMTITGAAGTLTLGDNMTLSGTLNLPIADTIISGGTVTLNGGTLQVDEDINFISDLAQQTSSSIVVANGKNLNYSGNEFNVGAQMLTLSGTGVFANTNNLTLNDPASSLKLNGISRVDNVSISAALTSGKLEIAQNATIGVLTHSGSSRIDIYNAKVLTLSNAFEIPSSQSMEMVGTDNGTLVLGNQLTLSGILKFSAPDTLSNGTLALNGGTLEVSKDASISSALLHEASSEVSVSNANTLTYSGSALDIGALTLTLSGGGTFANSTDLRFNDTASVLNFGGIAEVSKVSFPVSLQTGKLNVTQNAKIQTLTHPGESIINISSGKILTIAEAFTVGSSKSMVLNGAGGNLKLENTMTLSGTLQMDEQSTLDSGTLAFDGGIVSVNNNSTISSAITHAGSSTFMIASGKRLTMKSDFTVPASRKMSLTGSNGVLDLQNTLTLSGTLEFAVPQTLDNGTLALNGGTLSVKDDVTISSAIVHSSDSTVDISSGSTLTHSGGALNIGAKTLTFKGGGTFANVDQLRLMMQTENLNFPVQVLLPLSVT